MVFYNLYRSFISMSMLFINLAFLFDMFKWAIFLVSASLETSYLSTIEGEKLIARRNKLLKITLFITQGIISLIFFYFFIYSLFLIGNSKDYRQFAKIRNILLVSISFILLIMYVIIFSILRMRLINSYP